MGKLEQVLHPFSAASYYTLLFLFVAAIVMMSGSQVGVYMAAGIIPFSMFFFMIDAPEWTLLVLPVAFLSGHIFVFTTVSIFDARAWPLVASCACLLVAGLKAYRDRPRWVRLASRRS